MKNRLLFYACALALLISLFWNVKYRIDFTANDKVQDQALTYFVKSVNGTIGKKMKEKKLVEKLESERLAKFVAGAKKASKGARADSSLKATFTLSDTAKGTIVSPTVLCDEYGRFCFDGVGSNYPMLTRNQKLKFEGVFIRSPDGKVRAADFDLKEYKPGTDEVIPTKGLTADYEFLYVEQGKPKPPFFHPRLLASLDHNGNPGAGVELLNLERTEKKVLEKITLSANAYYDKKAKSVSPALQLGYRILNSNVTIGPTVGINGSTKALSVGAAASIQLTR